MDVLSFPSDRAGNIRRLRQIIKRIDHAGLTDVEVVPLQYANAQDVYQSIQKVMPHATGQHDNGQLGLNIAVDRRSNSLLLSGDPMVRKQVKKLIERLDQPLPSQVVTQVVKLSYANAKDLVPILKSVKGSVAASAKDQSFKASDVQIEVDASTNSLVITAPRVLLQTMLQVIANLDVRRSQVLVQAVIVEVNNEVARSLGIRWQSDVPKNGLFSGQNTVPGNLSTPTPPDLGAGLTLGLYKASDLRGLVRALESDTRSNVLSTPSIVALDNEQASILVGENVPFITGESTGSASSTSNPFQTIQRKDIGVTLKVTPRINNPKSVTLDIDQTTESLKAAAVQTADVVTSKRDIHTKVLLGSDQVLVLGGLIQNETDKVKTKVPILGDIPWLGKLFRGTKTTRTKKNLMVFIHPIILFAPASQRVATKRAYDYMHRLQEDFNHQQQNYLLPKPQPLLDHVIDLRDAGKSAKARDGIH